MPVIELADNPISATAAAALAADAQLPICTACATQYPAPRSDCPCCDDPRQYVPESGQSFTTLTAMSEGRRHTLLVDKDDERVTFVQTVPGFAINQTPILIQTYAGSVLWDCAAFISPQLIAHLSSLERPLVTIAISHPHFFSTSLVWARALRVPLYLNSADKAWYARSRDVKDDDKVVWWRDSVQLSDTVRLIECGGHFPGSSVLFWDRAAEAERTAARIGNKEVPETAHEGLLLVADTLMVQPSMRGFSFMWSYPNMIPLEPRAVQRIGQRLEGLRFGAATSAWPERFMRTGASDKLQRSIEDFVLHAEAKSEGEVESRAPVGPY